MRVGAVIGTGQLARSTPSSASMVVAMSAQYPGPRTSRRASNQPATAATAFPRHGGTSPAAAVAAARRYAPRRMEAAIWACSALPTGPRRQAALISASRPAPGYRPGRHRRDLEGVLILGAR